MQPHIVLLVAVSAAFLASPAHPQSSVSAAGTRQRFAAPLPARAEPPRGLYCSCPPTNGVSSSVMPSVAQLPFVEGILVRVAWKDVEPQRGQYDFSLIRGQLDLAELHGVRVTLALVQGSGTPAWLASEGAATVTYSFAGQDRTIAAAWDPVYQSIWQETILALGSAFASDTRISLVHVTNATHNGFEMQLPLGQEPVFVAAGYSDAGYIDSWKTSIDVFAAAFRAHPLDVEVHPVFGSDAPAQAVTAYGRALLGGSFGSFGAWWSVNNATQSYPGMYAILQGAAAAGFASVQVVGSWVTTPERFDFDLQEYFDTYSLAVANDIRYVEVWNADLLDPTLHGFLESVNDQLTQ